MLVVKVEVWPHGDEDAAIELDRVYAANDGTGGGEASEVGNYDVYTEDPRGRPKPRKDRPGWVGRVEGHDRTEPDKGRLSLAMRALLAVWMRRAREQNEEKGDRE